MVFGSVCFLGQKDAVSCTPAKQNRNVVIWILRVSVFLAKKGVVIGEALFFGDVTIWEGFLFRTRGSGCGPRGMIGWGGGSAVTTLITTPHES